MRDEIKVAVVAMPLLLLFMLFLVTSCSSLFSLLAKTHVLLRIAYKVLQDYV